jgi:spore coat polysaccharide biosynthesis protein SpsF
MQMSSQRVGILVQARMSSRRVPGKVLRKIAGRPLLFYVVECCKAVEGADLVAIITSNEASDDHIAAFAMESGTSLYRGSLEDVAGRFLGAAETFGLDAFVRVNADSPLLDPRLVGKAIALYREEGADLVTNVLRRTYPVGMSVEVLDRRRYVGAYAAMSETDEREHVTRYYYRHPELFRIVSFENGRKLGDRSLAVDTPDDLERIERILRAMDRPHCDYDCDAIIALSEALGALTPWSDLKP